MRTKQAHMSHEMRNNNSVIRDRNFQSLCSRTLTTDGKILKVLANFWNIFMKMVRLRLLICHVADRADNQWQRAAKMHFRVQNKKFRWSSKGNRQSETMWMWSHRGRRLAEISGDQEGTQGGKKQSTRGSWANQRSGNMLFTSCNITPDSACSVSIISLWLMFITVSCTAYHFDKYVKLSCYFFLLC